MVNPALDICSTYWMCQSCCNHFNWPAVGFIAQEFLISSDWLFYEPNTPDLPQRMCKHFTSFVRPVSVRKYIMSYVCRVNCSFFFKIGACRHGERCSRLHNKPTFSQTILLQNLYLNPANSAQVTDLGISQFFLSFLCTIYFHFTLHTAFMIRGVCWIFSTV